MSYARLNGLLTQKTRFWFADGLWHCAVPRKPNELDRIMNASWKTHGMIGRGKTRAQAKEDWEQWQRAFYVVEDCM